MSNSIDSVINFDWSPLQTSTSKVLASAILDPDFQKSLSAMLDEFESLTPVEYDGSGKAFVPMSEKYRLLDEHFPLGTFSYTTQFVDSNADAPICYATLNLLTDEGYLPWFSRLGMPNPENPSTDGKMADAENSAIRRLLIGLGLGFEGAAEIVDSNNVRYAAAIREYLVNNGNMPLSTLITNYKNHGGGLVPLKVKIDSKSAEKISLKDLQQEDIELLVGFIRRKGA